MVQFTQKFLKKFAKEVVRRDKWVRIVLTDGYVWDVRRVWQVRYLFKHNQVEMVYCKHDVGGIPQ